ncbi:hypothetical protein FQB35_14980 [Crassaminicella thermophila]|uniref:Lipoprotein n=1 Tax=Crassaminicella thermophila TaxID=2599308 RepID=A0A5C0SGM2_CRATE|nr:hypothetical protein [Crassaminicella thermophila]QEK13461.1 hypothetical protein FQB35_14980 [Crassaminicella thermophila]
MRKLLLFILAVSLILGGCVNKKNNTAKESEKKEQVNQENKREIKVNKEEEEKIMFAYSELIKKGKPYEVMTFINENIDKVSQKNAEEMIIGLEKVQKEYIDDYTDILFEGDLDQQKKKVDQLDKVFGSQFYKGNIEDIQDEDLRAFVVETLKGGYKYVMLEGAYYPIIDYSILRKYKPFLSDQMKDYIEITAEESDKLTWNDAAVVISWEELGNRVIQAENYVSKYPQSPKKKEVGELYAMYMGAYLYGASNTPLFDYETKEIKDELLKSYKKTISENPETVTAQTIKEYLKIIEENDYKVNDYVMDKANSLYKKAIESLKLNDIHQGY